MTQSNLSVLDGRPMPLGSSVSSKGVNFALFSRHGTSLRLCIFGNPTDSEPVFSYELDPHRNRTGDIWHCMLEGLAPGALYGWKVEGPFIPEKGIRFSGRRLLVDPYAKAVTGKSGWNLAEACSYKSGGKDADLTLTESDNSGSMPKCIVVDDSFDWQGDRPLNYPLRFSVLYETHVRGLSMLSGVEHPGTYRGVVEMIPFFKDLGITSVELLPIHEFDELEITRTNPKTGERLVNYWGYSTIAFFAPKDTYAASENLGGQVAEFKEMVRELHKAGLEIILDIVFNHTAEGNELGPTLSFRGLDNSIYYMLDENKRYYKNYSGCGNTLNCNHPVVRQLIIDCLHYWVVEMHVDGFRFDLGSILGRDQNGNMMENPPVLEHIAEDPILRHTKIIAEAWDAGGAYQVGWFPGGRWAEWNDRYRDDVRKFWRGDDGAVQGLTTRITGSSDLYLRDGRKPFHSINFITSHDGFTMNDLVTYNGKHNDENGESSNDGHNSNFCYNYGWEGKAANPEIEAVRNRQVKNFLATLLLSLGTPMILGGDEFRRTQKGNNNAYCHDNALSWYDWKHRDAHAETYRFAKRLMEFRKRHHAFLRPEFYTGTDSSYNAIPDIMWFDEKGNSPDWSSIQRHIGARIDGSKADVVADRDDNDFFLMFNSGLEQIVFKLPQAPDGKTWYRAIDTFRESPDDILEPGREESIQPLGEYVVRSRSFVLLLSK